jgi:peptidoglycan/xylan/chitin deacetylase (PgdA/CDA1 family)
MYHRIAVVPTDPWRMAVEPARFAEHLDVIATRFRPLRLLQLAERVRDQDVPRNSVAVTFDDGYRDNLYAAKPLLERHEVPATVFVATGYLDSGRDFWWEALLRACREIAEPGSEAAVCRALHRLLQPIDHDQRNAILDAVIAQLDPIPVAGASTFTTAELVELAEGGLVDLGAHTVTHPALPTLSHARQLEEMRISKRQLEESLGRPVRGFSYPFGATGTESAGCALEAGFIYACTSEPSPVTAATDLFQLPRLHAENWTGEELERRLSALLDGV